MNSNVIKIAALAGAGYLVWKQFSPASTDPAAAATPSGSQPSSPSSPAPTPTIPAVQSQPPVPSGSGYDGTDTSLKRAAAFAGWAGEAGTKRLNFHQWNYYRRAYNPDLATPAPEDVGQGDGSALLTASE